MPLFELPQYVVTQVATSIAHNWPFLLLGILTAAALKVYVGTDRIAALLRRRTDVAVASSVTAAVATPFCSCGTTAVVISMLAASVPWAPVVAFMVASPLSSPDGLFLSAGLFGWPFAVYLFAASIVLGVAGGVVAQVAENAGLLENQARFVEKTSSGCGDTCGSAGKPAARPEPPAPPRAPAPVVTASAPSTCGCGSVVARPSLGPGAASVAEFAPWWVRFRLPELWEELRTSAPRMLAMFVGFAAIGYLAIGLIPTAWMTSLLGGSSPLSVVLAATLGLPLYLSDGSLPLVASLMHGGMGPGPAVAFLVTGAGTSVGAVSGGLLIARWRVLAIVVGTLWVGAIVLGILAGFVL
jgi:uncharacterized membrane protein YraQ (UPF0718 family)